MEQIFRIIKMCNEYCVFNNESSKNYPNSQLQRHHTASLHTRICFADCHTVAILHLSLCQKFFPLCASRNETFFAVKIFAIFN